MTNPSATLNQSALIAAVADASGLSKKAVGLVLDAYACIAVGRLQDGQRTPLPGLGILEPAIQAPRSGTFNGVAYTTPARTRPRLSPSAGVLRALNPGQSDPAADPVPAAA